MNILLKLYSSSNLGDDLFLKIICERFPQVQFFLLANDDYIAFNKWKNLTIYTEQYTESVFSRAKRVLARKFFPNLYERELQHLMLKQNRKIFNLTDCFVSIGGSIFIQNMDDIRLDREIAYYNLIMSELKSIPKFFMGCNFGPYRSEQFYGKYRNIFEKCTDICFREKYSLDLFKGLPNVRLAPDIVFGMKAPAQKKEKNTVGFSIISPRNGIDEHLYYQKYAALIEAYQKRGFSIFLFSFCKNEGDERAIEQVIRLLKSNAKLERVYYNGNIEEFLIRYALVEYMYCGRFHAMILSMLYNQKIYPVVYSKKMINVLEDIQYQGDYIDVNTIGEINIPYILNQINVNSYNIEAQKKAAVEHFAILDILLQERAI